jgi:hypothetical protein
VQESKVLGVGARIHTRVWGRKSVDKSSHKSGFESPRKRVVGVHARVEGPENARIHKQIKKGGIRNKAGVENLK